MSWDKNTINNSEKEYKTTYDECKVKAGNLVCPQCGKPVEPIETVDNSYDPTWWVGCQDCLIFTPGVSIWVYEAAKKMVIEEHFVAFHHIGYPKNEDDTQKQIQGATMAISLVLRVLGISYQDTENCKAENEKIIEKPVDNNPKL